MKKTWIAIVILLGVAAGAYYLANRESESVAVADPEGSLTYFSESLTEKVKARVDGYDKLGLGGGVDGFVLIKAYPRMRPADFIGVEAYQGGYSEKDGKVLFTGNGASNSGVIERKGMKTLLGNISKRLKISVDTKEGIDKILKALEGR